MVVAVLVLCTSTRDDCYHIAVFNVFASEVPGYNLTLYQRLYIAKNKQKKK